MPHDEGTWRARGGERMRLPVKNEKGPREVLSGVSSPVDCAESAAQGSLSKNRTKRPQDKGKGLGFRKFELAGEDAFFFFPHQAFRSGEALTLPPPARDALAPAAWLASPFTSNTAQGKKQKKKKRRERRRDELGQTFDHRIFAGGTTTVRRRNVEALAEKPAATNNRADNHGAATATEGQSRAAQRNHRYQQPRGMRQRWGCQ